jgi:hypothetical protein
MRSAAIAAVLLTLGGCGLDMGGRGKLNGVPVGYGVGVKWEVRALRIDADEVEVQTGPASTVKLDAGGGTNVRVPMTFYGEGLLGFADKWHAFFQAGLRLNFADEIERKETHPGANPGDTVEVYDEFRQSEAALVPAAGLEFSPHNKWRFRLSFEAPIEQWQREWGHVINSAKLPMGGEKSAAVGIGAGLKVEYFVTEKFGVSAAYSHQELFFTDGKGRCSSDGGTIGLSLLFRF